MPPNAYADEMSVLYRLMNAEEKTWPFPHLLVHEIFPPDLYARLIETLPPDSAYDAIQDYGTVGVNNSNHRLILSLDRPPQALASTWRQLADWLLGSRFTAAMMRKFRPYLLRQHGETLAHKKLRKDARLIRDFSDYTLPPHTDATEKALSFLFYLPRDDRFARLGTSVYVPNDPDFRCPGGPHHPRENFTLLTTAPFLPNTLFGFVRTDNAFHGVEPVTEAGAQRDLLLYNLYLTPQ